MFRLTVRLLMYCVAIIAVVRVMIWATAERDALDEMGFDELKDEVERLEREVKE